MYCERCGASILPGEQECQKCSEPLETAVASQAEKIINVSCDRCGHYPVLIPVGGWGDCPKCGKSHS